MNAEITSNTPETEDRDEDAIGLSGEDDVSFVGDCVKDLA
jgi:hypothetical protein